MSYCRATLVTICLCIAASSAVLGQTGPVSDPQALSFASQAISSLLGGNSISDVTLSATATSSAGDSSQTGSATIQAKGQGQSRLDVQAGDVSHTEVRNLTSGLPAGAWNENSGNPISFASHNCLTDAVWFFPALSTLSQTSNASFIFLYLGQVQRGDVTTEHLQVYQWSPSGSPFLAPLSTMDFYLNATSLLPVAISFNAHPDDDMITNIPVEIDFSNYQLVNGVQVPFHIQKLFNGTLVLDVTVSTVAFNTGIPDSVFILP